MSEHSVARTSLAMSSWSCRSCTPTGWMRARRACRSSSRCALPVEGMAHPRPGADVDGVVCETARGSRRRSRPSAGGVPESRRSKGSKAEVELSVKAEVRGARWGPNRGGVQREPRRRRGGAQV
eukprot:4127376-Prymnesium_polylepis.1